MGDLGPTQVSGDGGLLESADVDEGDSGTGPTITFTIVWDRASEKDNAYLLYRIGDEAQTGSTATDGTDFSTDDTAQTGDQAGKYRNNLADNSPNQVITMTVAPDTDFEPDETVRLKITNRSEVTINIQGGQFSEHITIKNDDDPPLSTLALTSLSITPSFSASVTGYTAGVGSSVGSVTVEATSPAGSDITVTGTATDGTTALTVTEGTDTYTVSGLTEGANEIDVVVAASPADANSTSQTYTIEVTRAAAPVTPNNEPVITSNGGGPTATISYAEDRTNAVATVQATDDDNDSIEYTISGGADSSAFNIGLTSGALTFKAAPDFESPGSSLGTNVYVVIVRASDGTAHDEQTLTVTVTGVNEPPRITTNGGGATADIDYAENSTDPVTDVDATDPEGALITYAIPSGALGGTDGDKFSIDSGTGVLTFDAVPNFESPTDSGTNNTYEVVVQAGDGTGLTDFQTITVTVTNVNEPPKPTGDDETPSVNENTATTIATVTHGDPDVGDTILYTLGGDDADKFSVDGNGNLAFNPAPDYENATDEGGTDGDNVYVVNVIVTDADGLNDDVEFTVTVNDVNEAPEFATNTVAFDVEENDTAVADKEATDEDSADDVAYALSGADAGKFRISTSGVLTFFAAPDHEEPTDALSTDPSNDAGNNVYIVVVTATGGTGTRAMPVSQTITVTVTDVNEAPKFANTTTTFTVAENDTDVGTKLATDEDGADSVAYALSGADSGAFNISTAGVLTFKAAPNYEEPTDALSTDPSNAAENNVYIVVVTATGGTGTRAMNVSQTITVTVTDVNEAPEFTTTTTEFSVEENDTAVGDKAATDEDSADDVTYALSGADKDAFSISTEGVLTFATAPDHEDPTDVESTDPSNDAENNEYIVVVTATGGTGTRAMTASQTITVTVTDEAETDVTLSGLEVEEGDGTAVTISPVFSAAETSYTASVDNDVSSVKVTPEANHPDATLAVTATDPDSGSLTVTESSGVYTVASLGEGANVITIEVTAEDGTTVINPNYTVTVTRAAPDTAPDFGSEDVADQTGNSAWKVGVAITAVTLPTATGGNGTLEYELSPAITTYGLTLTDRVISGTPTKALATATTFTWTVSDGDDNEATTDKDTVTFDVEINKGDQSLSGGGDTFNITFGDAVPTLPTITPTPATGGGTIVYDSWDSGSIGVCTLDSDGGNLDITASGSCDIRAAADENANYNEMDVVYLVARINVKPAKPVFDEVTAGDGSITLTWEDPSDPGIIGYRYRHCEPGAVNCSVWSDVTGTDRSVTITTGLANGTNYQVKLQAEAMKTPNSLWSDVATSETVMPQGQAPDFGMEDVDDQTGNSAWKVGVAITAVTLPEATGGNGTLEYELSPDITTYGLMLTDRVISGTPDKALTTATEFTWTVSDGDGNEATTDEDTVTFDVEIKKGDQTLTAVVYSSTAITFGEAAPTVTTAASVTVPSGNAGALTYVSRNSTVCSVDSAAALTIDTSGVCRIRVRAASTDDYNVKTADSAPISVTPATPTISLDAGDGSIELTWNDPSDLGITGYEYRSCEGTCDATDAWTDATTGEVSMRTIDIGSLTNDIAHTVELRANAGSLTSTAASKTATPEADAPADLEPTFGSEDVDDQTGTSAWKVGVPIPTLTLPTATGGDGTLSYTLDPDISDPTVEDYGLTLTNTASTKEISGTPDTALTTAMEFTWTVSDADNDTDSITFDVAINKGDQDLNGGSLSSNSMDFGETVTINPPTNSVGSAGGAISYASTGDGNCTISGTTVTAGSVGSCAIAASAAMNANYEASDASPIGTLAIAKGTQSLGNGEVTLPITYGEAAPALPALTQVPATGGGTIAYDSSDDDVCTIDTGGGNLAIGQSGSCDITATISGNTNWNALTDAYTVATINVTPAMPAITLTPSNSQITLTWTDPGDSGIDAYDYRSCEGTCDATDGWTDATTGEVSARTIVISSLTNGTSYAVQLRAKAGTLISAEASKTATPVDESTQPPGKPTSVTAEWRGPFQGTYISWTAPSGGADTYDIQGRLTGTQNTADIATDVSGTSYNASASWRAQVDAYRVRAVRGGVAGRVVGLGRARSGGGPRRAHRSDGPAAGANSVTLTWVKPVEGANIVTGYHITMTPAKLGAVFPTTDGNSTMGTVSGLECGTRYTFTVSAKSQGNQGPPSSEAFADTDATPCLPAKPANLSATGGSGSITLTWDASTDTTITKYQYQICNADGTGCTAWGHDEIAASATSHKITGLENGKRYRLFLRAVSANGIGFAAGPCRGHTLRAHPDLCGESGPRQRGRGNALLRDQPQRRRQRAVHGGLRHLRGAGSDRNLRHGLHRRLRHADLPGEQCVTDHQRDPHQRRTG